MGCGAYPHVIEPHAPYEPPAEDALRVAPHGELLLAEPPPRIAGFPPFARGQSVSEEHRQALVRAQDAEIAAADRALGRLFEELGRGRPTIVAVTADHGQDGTSWE